MKMDPRDVIVWLSISITMATEIITHAHKVTVKTDKGLVQGRQHKVPGGEKVNVFYGIPYARPPTGDLRFLHPEQLDPWTDVLDATQKPNCCIQLPDTFFGNFSGATLWNPNTKSSEDCLYLNIWAPHRHHNAPHKAVMVWIYGGSFMTGSSVLDIYDAKYLAAYHDVVVVSMQFRFGALGYFVLGSPESPGNAGMLDVRMALEWIQRNIYRFGGNAHNVTLMGESSGAVSIGHLMLSSLGRGLFHRAILQSGSPQVHWGSFSLEEGKRRSKYLAELLGCDPNSENWKMLQCLRKVDAHRFAEAELKVTSGVAQFPFLPVIDGTFLTKSPKEYLQEGSFKKIPVLLGSNANEGSWLLVYASPNDFRINSSSEISPEGYDRLMDSLFQYYPQYPKELNSHSLYSLKFRYKDWLKPNDGEKLRTSIEKATGDYHFTCGVTDMAQTVAKYGQDVYLYRFSHRMSTSAWPEWMGVLHGDEIFFVFGRPLDRELGYNDRERQLSRKMMTWWTNFAKTGDPNKGTDGSVSSDWPKFTVDNQRYLDIKTSILDGERTWVEGLRPEYCAFWNEYIPRLAEMDMYPSNCTHALYSRSNGVKTATLDIRTLTLSTVVALIMTLTGTLSSLKMACG